MRAAAVMGLLLMLLAATAAGPSPSPTASPSAAPASPSAAPASPTPSPHGLPLPRRTPPPAHARPTSRPRLPRHPDPALPAGSGLHAVIRIAYQTRSRTESAQGAAKWRFDVPRLVAVYSRRGTTSYLARGGSWEGVGRAAGARVLAAGGSENPLPKPQKVEWFYAFSHQAPLDRPSRMVRGAIDNCQLTLLREPSGRVRYRFTLHGNGPGRDVTDDTFVVVLHSRIEHGRETRQKMNVGWAPVLTVGLLPGDTAGDTYAPQYAIAGIVALRRPRHALPGQPLEGRERFTRRLGTTRYTVDVHWTTR